MRLKQTNEIIREAIIKTGHFQWEVAKRLGYGESVFSSRLREELPLNEQSKLVDEISKIKW